MVISFSFSNVSGSLNKRNVTLGDVFVYSISVPRTLTISADPIIVNNLDDSTDLVLVSQNLVINKVSFVHQYFLSSYNLGDFIIPTMEVLINKSRIMVPGDTITIKSVFIKGVSRNMVLKLKSQENIVLKWWNYVLLLFVCLIIAAFIIWILSKIKQAQDSHTQVTPVCIDPFKDANQKLDHLESSDLLEVDMKQYYFEISTIIKEYLSRRFDEHLMELTTYEIKQILPKILSIELSAEFYQFLISLDPVKYAKYQPSINESKGKIKQARHLLIATEDTLSKTLEDDHVF